ncbi:uncharacterized protein LOC120655357 isoform X2 [Panicum virgatum]|uniref:uncharacterized protein LOC120655357 isoform X2 n=1 Tax=Panicum virgatum TaxID=38727 RepID=UPI0019D6A057|nr:uncharacterized protein LOC120655357 isoform X2 [Panicum virgatum]
MFHVWRAVRWWDEWQLRILVLGSLCLQWFLLLVAPMRKYTIPRCLRGCIWLAYISSDALAIYALATLFNRHARASASTGTSCAVGMANILEVLWAPILLIHLGGQEELTAYTIEDNELWTRHTVTLVSQVAVALYAFYKSWPASSDWKLLASAILLFVIGVASFSEKPWALNRASINRLASVSAKIQGTKKPSKWGVYLDDLVFSDWYKCFTMSSSREAGGDGHWYNCFRGDDPSSSKGTPGDDGEVLSKVDKVYMILSDLSLLAAADDLKLRGMDKKGDEVLRPLGTSARKEMRRWLRGAFGFIYTRANVVVHPAYLTYHVLVAPVLHVAALALFATSDKRRYSRADVKTTYVLMCFTAALDVLAVFIRQLLYKAMSSCPALCETVPGYNLVDAAVRRAHRGVGLLLRCAAHAGCKEEDFDCNAGEKYATYETVSTTVMGDLADARGRDLASYRSFHFLHRRHIIPYPDDADMERAHAPAWTNWALSKELQEMCGPRMRRSLRGSFDRSIVVWHIATDLCFRTDPNNPRVQLNSDARSNAASSGSGLPPWCCPPLFLQAGQGRRAGAAAGNAALGSPSYDEVLRNFMSCAASISDYMAHLLNYHPEMLLTGSRQHLVTEAIREMEDILHHDITMYKGDSHGRTGEQPSTEVLNRIIEVYSEWRPASKKLRINRSRNKVDLPGEEAAAATGGAADEEEVSLFHIPQACRVAKELREIEDADVRWHLMYRVWLGMLCYSASMCRGYLHAKSLGEGGEFLSYLWLVLSLRGAETLADKLQMPEGDDYDDELLADDDDTPNQQERRRF